MAAHGFALFDTTVGRCGIAWGRRGVVGVQLREARELETRVRLPFPGFDALGAQASLAGPGYPRVAIDRLPPAGDTEPTSVGTRWTAWPVA